MRRQRIVLLIASLVWTGIAAADRAVYVLNVPQQFGALNVDTGAFTSDQRGFARRGIESLAIPG